MKRHLQWSILLSVAGAKFVCFPEHYKESAVFCEISLPKGTVVTHIRQALWDATAVLSPV